MNRLDTYFHISQRESTLPREIRGGFTTFFSIAYLTVIIPAFLSRTGMDAGAVTAATCLIAGISSLAMGLIAKLPFVLAPGIGFSTMFTLTLCEHYGYTWQQALALVFLSGILFLVFTLTPLRARIIDAIPMPLRFSLSAGVGLMITLQALVNSGLITADNNLLDMGAIISPGPLLTLFGIFLTAALLLRKVPGGLMIGMAVVLLLGIPLGITVLPEQFMALPHLSATAFKLDFAGLLSQGVIPLISSLITLTLCDCFDTVGNLLGVGSDAGLTDSTGELPRQKAAMAVDAASTCVGALLGVSTVTTLAESATGIREGSRTGLSAVVTGLLFLLFLPFTPLLANLSGPASVAALVISGMTMMSGITQIQWKHVEVSLPCFLIIVCMPFTFSITTGLALGVISYLVIMVCRKRAAMVDPVLYGLSGLFALMFLLGAVV
ncbi:MAG: NCS2 family permease [Oscillospiraceae bacterium]